MALSETARERDLYKYYQPWIDVQALGNVPIDEAAAGLPTQTHRAKASHDKTLTAFAQLAALRLNVKRGMISLIDTHHQIILAEATKSLSLADDNRHKPGDHIWLGNVSLPRADCVDQHAFGSMYTPKDDEGKDVELEALVIPELREDDRFKDKPYVTAEGGVRFYAGVPIITRAGHKIGVYAVSDVHPRHGLTLDEVNFMQDVAVTVFEHLESIKSRYDNDRGQRMVKGLATFIEELSSMKHESGNAEDDQREQAETMETTVSEHFHATDPQEGNSVLAHRDHGGKKEASDEEASAQGHSSDDSFPNFGNKAGHGKESQPFSTDSDNVKGVTETGSPVTDLKQIFFRAAQIIRRCTRADGCVFFDASSGTFGDGTPLPGSDPKMAGLDHLQTSGSDTDNYDRYRRRGRRGTDSSSGHSDSEKRGGTSDSEKTEAVSAQVLGAALKNARSAMVPGLTLPEDELKKCLQRYPYGRIFHFDEEGTVSSGDESMSDETISGGGRNKEGSRNRHNVRSKKKRRKKFLPKDLFKLLPGVRAVIFLPLFDYAQSRWFAGGFLWSNSSGRLSGPGDEMPYLKAFGSCIMSEVASLEAMNTNRAKATFIASISHELRSPLHGILGSIEFLEDTLTTAYQMGLIGSIETCGKTLLDTIDHLLDYAKINNLNKANSRRSSRSSSKSSRHSLSITPQSMSSLVANLDLACLVEDVIEAVFAGQTFRKAQPRGRAGDNAVQDAITKMHELALDDSISTEDAVHAGSDKFSGRVVVVLNVAKANSWWVRSQPGGLRRVIMNIFGNAIKYCSTGSIEASVVLIQAGKTAMNVEFIIKDTGRGMSKEFMENHLFRAFSQEDTFSYGTGLGLSIVKQIVDSLGGKIDVKSQKNVGTEVKVSLCLPLSDSHRRRTADEDILESAAKITRGKRICLLYPEVTEAQKSDPVQLSKLTGAIAKTCRDWFDMEFIENATVEADADIFLYAEPPPIEYLLEHHSERKASGKSGKEAALLITCTNAFEAASLRASGVQNLTSLGRVIEVVSQPTGPRKLARVLLQCLRRVDELDHQVSSSQMQAKSAGGFATTDVQQRAAQTEWNTSTTLYEQTQGKHRPSIDTFRWKSDPPPTEKGYHVPGALDAALEWGKIKAGDLPISDTPKSEGLSASPPSYHDESKGLSSASSTAHVPHVLLVDDNAINLKLLVTFMKKIKLPFAEAVNGLDALEKFKRSSQPFDFVLMDISMPVMDGLTSTRRIREYERESKVKPATIIALTGLASANVQEEAFSAGISHFLAKPVRFKALQHMFGL